MRFVILDFGTAQREALRLAGGGRAAFNMFPAMEKISMEMLAAEEQLFISQGRRGGGSWARLKPDTVRKKGSSKILYTEGAHDKYKPEPPSGENILFKSMTKVGARFQYLKVFKNSIHFGTNRPFAAVHQYGSPARKIPARPFLRFTPGDVDRWNAILSRHVMKPHTIK